MKAFSMHMHARRSSRFAAAELEVLKTQSKAKKTDLRWRTSTGEQRQKSFASAGNKAAMSRRCWRHIQFRLSSSRIHRSRPSLMTPLLTSVFGEVSSS